MSYELPSRIYGCTAFGKVCNSNMLTSSRSLSEESSHMLAVSSFLSLDFCHNSHNWKCFHKDLTKIR